MDVNCGPEMSAARSKMDGAAERNKHGNCRRSLPHTKCGVRFGVWEREGCFVVGEVFPLNEIRFLPAVNKQCQ